MDVIDNNQVLPDLGRQKWASVCMEQRRIDIWLLLMKVQVLNIIGILTVNFSTGTRSFCVQ